MLITSAISSSSTSSFDSRVPSRCESLVSSSASLLSSCVSVPYLSSAARLRSYWRSAWSISTFVCSICSRRSRSFCTDVLLRIPSGAASRSLCRCAQFGQLFLDAAPSARAGGVRFLFRSASRSISSCMIRRETSSSSCGIESISVRSFAAASSTKSIALSGKKRSVM